MNPSSVLAIPAVRVSDHGTSTDDDASSFVAILPSLSPTAAEERNADVV